MNEGRRPWQRARLYSKSFAEFEVTFVSGLWRERERESRVRAGACTLILHVFFLKINVLVMNLSSKEMFIEAVSLK